MDDQNTEKKAVDLILAALSFDCTGYPENAKGHHSFCYDIFIYKKLQDFFYKLKIFF